MVIEESNWNTLTSLIEQVVLTTQQESHLLDKISTLSNNITSLQTTFDGRLTLKKA